MAPGSTLKTSLELPVSFTHASVCLVKVFGGQTVQEEEPLESLNVLILQSSQRPPELGLLKVPGGQSEHFVPRVSFVLPFSQAMHVSPPVIFITKPGAQAVHGGAPPGPTKPGRQEHASLPTDEFEFKGHSRQASALDSCRYVPGAQFSQVVNEILYFPFAHSKHASSEPSPTSKEIFPGEQTKHLANESPPHVGRYLPRGQDMQVDSET